jgi:hypothetical protein
MKAFVIGTSGLVEGHLLERLLKEKIRSEL